MNAVTLILDQKWTSKVEELRRREYAKAKGFSVDLQSLQWRSSDDQSYVLGATQEEKLLATMRGEIIFDESLLEKKLECPWSFPLSLDYPVLLLSRAATLSEYRDLGLNTVLRYYFFKLALHYSIPYVLGTFIAGSPREKSLRDMGYEFFENSLGWQKSTYKSLAQVQIVALDMKKNGNKALKYCESKYIHSIHTFHFDEKFSDLRVVDSL